MGKASSDKKQRRVERPGLFAEIDSLRAGRDWPEWCLIPSEKLLPLVRPQLAELDHGERDDLVQALAEDAACELAALYAWQLTKGVYLLDPDLLAALSDTDLSDEIPADALQRLPEWCVYVTSSGGFSSCEGFFARLDWSECEGSSLLLLQDQGQLFEGQQPQDHGEVLADLFLNCVKIPLSGSLRDGLSVYARKQLVGQEELLGRLAPGEDVSAAAAAAAAVVDGTMRFASLAVSVLLYLSSSEPDLSRRPTVPRQKGRAVDLLPAAVWEVGWRVGQVLRDAGAGGGGRGVDDRSGPRPHIRRAHWHLYWVGPKSDPSLRRRELRWVAPVVVAAGEEIVPTVRRLS
jgi:hypothetical protein